MPNLAPFAPGRDWLRCICPLARGLTSGSRLRPPSLLFLFSAFFGLYGLDSRINIELLCHLPRAGLDLILSSPARPSSNVSSLVPTVLYSEPRNTAGFGDNPKRAISDTWFSPHPILAASPSPSLSIFEEKFPPLPPFVLCWGWVIGDFQAPDGSVCPRG